MNVDRVSDGYLARRAAKGEGAAFAELARRYRALLEAAIARVPEGYDREDARQEALLGLYVACRATDGRRPFAGIAKLNVRWRIARASRDAARLKHRVLTHAVRDPGAGEPAVGWLPAPDAADPARVVELREQLRESVRAHPGALRLVLDEQDSTCRHSAATVAHALELVAQGQSVSQAARAVGASYAAVREWIIRAPADSPARRVLAVEDNPHARRYSDAQRRHAVELVTEQGHTYREAAAAVGAAQMSVHRWVHAAA